MLENNEATSVLEQTENAAQLAANELTASNPDDDSIVLVEEGEWEDPRQTFTVRITDNHGQKINAVGKLQRSVTGTLPDGTTILISAFGEKAQDLQKKAKLGSTCTFRGKYKEKSETFRGKEKTSRFLNL